MVLVNGLPGESIRVFDRGLMYGDGVFRTLLVRNGKPLCWSSHYAKLNADCAALGIVCPGVEILLEEAMRLIQSDADGVLKIVITRGESGRGYAVPEGMEPTRILLTSPLPAYPDGYHTDGVRVHLCSTRLALQPALAGIKHLNRLENVLARREWNTPGIAEGVMLDMEGNVIEGTMTNLFVLRGDKLYTPKLDRCGVAGVQRERILGLADRLGLELRIEALSLPFVFDADEVLLCNSIIGIWPVRELGGREVRTGGVAGQLRGWLLHEND
jgi:4-amino-4-deoxychorismate lyase